MARRLPEEEESKQVPQLEPRPPVAAATDGCSSGENCGEEQEEEEGLGRRLLEENRKLWVVAGPSIFTRFSTFGVTVISHAFIGHIGATEIAAYALVSTVLMRFTTGILLGMASALETLCGQSYGAKQYHMQGIYLQRSWIILRLRRRQPPHLPLHRAAARLPRPGPRDLRRRRHHLPMVHPRHVLQRLALHAPDVPAGPEQEHRHDLPRLTQPRPPPLPLVAHDRQVPARTRRSHGLHGHRHVDSCARAARVRLLWRLPPDMDWVLIRCVHQPWCHSQALPILWCHARDQIRRRVRAAAPFLSHRLVAVRHPGATGSRPVASSEEKKACDDDSWKKPLGH